MWRTPASPRSGIYQPCPQSVPGLPPNFLLCVRGLCELIADCFAQTRELIQGEHCTDQAPWGKKIKADILTLIELWRRSTVAWPGENVVSCRSVVRSVAIALPPFVRPPRLPLILLNKPYRVLSQFRDVDGRPTLAALVTHKDVYAAGRLDFESEGLLLLTDDGRLQSRITEPTSKITKTYWTQVEGSPSAEQLTMLIEGITLKDGPARARSAQHIITPENLWQRDPPIRHRVSVANSWMEIRIAEGRNRQVRRMTAAVGLPTLRLIRAAVGPWSLDNLQPGESRAIDNQAAWQQLSES